MESATRKCSWWQLLKILLILPTFVTFSNAIRCWQCAAVDGRKCPGDATLVNSQQHDACITWRVGNGTVLLQNLVRFSEECAASKIKFWSNFIDLYYQGTGGNVQCCSGDGCNLGTSQADVINRFSAERQPVNPEVIQVGGIQGLPQGLPQGIQGLPAELPGASLSSFLQQTSAYMPQTVQAQGIRTQNFQLNGAQDLQLQGFPQTTGNSANGDCQQYFDKISAEEWLPRILVPLTFDRASETKVGVFYTKFKTYNSNNDHVIVRLIDSQKSNSTMYSIKLYRVGTATIYVSKLNANTAGELQRSELRKVSVNNAVNISDSNYNGFWFTLKDEEELTMGLIGDQLIEPVILWNDTLREGPKDVKYFGLTTDSSSATFGVNCDVPNLHFPDTCVEDDDCEDFPNTVCRNSPVNSGLDPGTRELPFTEWEPRDALLKSCFCKEGHVRIPQSQGCYDPIRKVVTLMDACFANYHCNDLPNTHCTMDKNVPKFNNSCQCIKGNKPFDPDPRTGLIEGCAPLTDADKATILGCATRFKIDDGLDWVPEVQHATDYDAQFGVDVGTVYVNLGRFGDQDDVAVVRLLDEVKNSRKMYTIKWYRNRGKISISESTRTRSFFFENERDSERASVDDLDTLARMQTGFVGFWIMYKYDDVLNGAQLSVGLNGAPFSPDYALVKWTDTGSNAMRSVKYMGFTASSGAEIEYGTNCVLLNTQIGLGINPFVQIQPQSINLNQVQPQFFNQIQSQANFGAALNQIQPQQSNFAALNQIQSGPTVLQPNFGALLASGRSPSVDSNENGVQILEPNSQPGIRQQVPQGAKPWLLNPNAAMELEIVTEPQETIIEPVLRNQYLTKLKRLLPTFFDDFNREEMEAILQKHQNKEVQMKNEDINLDLDVDTLESQDYYSR